MKTKISTLFIAVTLLLSSCAKEYFYFTNTGTSYGSKKVNLKQLRRYNRTRCNCC